MKRNASVTKNCLHCKNDFSVWFSRKDSAKFCSRNCSDLYPREHNKSQCRECGSIFAVKLSQNLKSKLGSFCSQECCNKAKSRLFEGNGNPNWRGGRNFDQDGYALHSPAASRTLGLGTLKIHQANALIHLGLKKIPLGMHVHHRDCNRLNNELQNLQLINQSDHKWLHHQFGVSVLRAIYKGFVDPIEAASWSDDPIRATGLLVQNLPIQKMLMDIFTSENQMPLISQIAAIKPIRVTFEVVDELGESQRGAGGFGSTGA